MNGVGLLIYIYSIEVLDRIGWVGWIFSFYYRWLVQYITCIFGYIYMEVPESSMIILTLSESTQRE